MFERFGVPGLALQGPAITGTFPAAVISLGLCARQRSVITWSLASIVLWTTLLVIVTVFGVSLF